jgi:rubrerythrin
MGWWKRNKETNTADGQISAAVVLQRCADLEADGLAFYESMLKGAQTEWMRKLAATMVRAEKRHRARFLRYAEEARRQSSGSDMHSPKSMSPELQRLLSEREFSTQTLAERAAGNMTNREALETAIRHETNLALLFSQFRQYVSHGQRKYIDRVIREEQQHEAKLVSFRQKYFGPEQGDASKPIDNARLTD